MNQIEERLAKAVRKYEHLYDASLKGYKDGKMANNSWAEIATNVGLSVPECIKRWRSLRDKYVRIRRKMSSSSGDAGGQEKVPALNSSLSWLGPHIKHRETSSNYDELTSEGRDNEGPLKLLSPSVSPIDDRQSSTSSSPLESRSSSPAQSNSSTSVTSTQLTTLPLAFTPPVSMSPQLPTFLSPVTKTEPSLSRTGRKRQREQQEDDNFTQKLDQLEESMLLMHRRLERPEDEISRFGQTICDMLRKVPEDDQGDAMQAVYNLLYGFRKRPCCILKMNQIEERLAEEVRNYEHLYDTSLRGYKDAQKANNSWMEIAENVGLSVPECIKRWRSLRDKYVRIRRKMSSSSGDAGSQHMVPALSFLSWLAPHIKHRETSSNYDVKEHTSQGRDNGGPLELLSPSESPIDDLQSSTSSSPLESRSSSPAPSNSSMSTQLSPFPSPRQRHLLCPAQDGKGKGSSRTTEILLKKLDQLEKSRLLIQRRLERSEHDIKIQTDGV